jgi:general secretion pathway protein D
LAQMDTEYLSTNMRAAGPAPGKDIEMGDWLVVTAGPDLLMEIEHFIDTFAGGPPQIEIEAKIVEFVERDSLDLGVQNVSMDFPSQALVSEVGFDFPNQASADTGGEIFARISAIHDGVVYAAMFEALAAYENVEIISRPKVAVREGIKAKIEAVQRIPFLRVTGINNSGNATTVLDFQDVGVQLYVTPRLVGTGTIALQIDIQASQQTGDAVTLEVGGAETTRVISTPILSTRSAETLVYLKPGQAVILGGLISERRVERENGIPFLKDLPIVGYLFKSTLESTEKTTLLFYIRPRKIEGTDFNQPFE